MGLTNEEKNRAALDIATQVSVGMRAFVAAGVEILRRDFDFTDKQLSEWATNTLILAGDNLNQAVHIARKVEHERIQEHDEHA